MNKIRRSPNFIFVLRRPIFKITHIKPWLKLNDLQDVGVSSGKVPSEHFFWTTSLWEYYSPWAVQSNLLRSMELGGETVSVGGNSSLGLVSEKAIIVNSIPLPFTIANLPILVATLAANIWAIFIINRKETSRINRLEIPFIALEILQHHAVIIFWCFCQTYLSCH